MWPTSSCSLNVDGVLTGVGLLGLLSLAKELEFFSLSTVTAGGEE